MVKLDITKNQEGNNWTTDKLKEWAPVVIDEENCFEISLEIVDSQSIENCFCIH